MCKLSSVHCSGHGLSSHAPAGSTYHYLDGVTHIERVTRYLGWKNFSLLGKKRYDTINPNCTAIAHCFLVSPVLP